ncbi:MAG TPA: acetate--CoA ligase family protein [Steroidobacteraceae bacterium]|nr:acetate--CoA ligase family protein [Steroidobacteraceae bacterium]
MSDIPRAAFGRLIAPRTIALIGASGWTDAVAAGNRAIGYRGELFRVNPKRAASGAAGFYSSVADLPEAPDAAFVAVPNADVPSVAAQLARRGAGGFVCFASGFSELGTEQGEGLTRQLLEEARELPFFGPNCYGFVNYFDRAALLPDQVVGSPAERGVAMICQSGTIALTLSFNHRSVPLGYLFTVGNQSRIAVEDLIDILAEDARVSAFGLYLEGIRDAGRFAAAVEKAHQAGKPIAVVKSGRTEAAARTARSHTGALAGSDGVFDAFCRQAGLARCDTLSTLCETLKVLHVAAGPLTGRRVLIMGASGGDMAMTADVSRSLPLEYPPLPPDTATALKHLLTDRVTVANPFDVHTYLWYDPPGMGRVFAAAMRGGYDAVGFMLDCPPPDRADLGTYEPVIDAFIAAAQGAPTRATLIASLPETLNERIRQRCLAGGVIPLQGQREALEALAGAAAIGVAWRQGSVELRRPAIEPARALRALSEPEGKAALSRFGVAVPRGRAVAVAAAAAAAEALGFPVVMKAVGAHLEHKSELGAVIVNIRDRAAAQAAAQRLGALSETLLVEEMTTDGVAEILVGVTLDPQFGQVLVLGAGGVQTELLGDSVTLLPPWNRPALEAALSALKVGRLLRGFRGKPAGDVPALIDTVLGVTRFAREHLATLAELDVNPVIVRPAGRGAVAVDVLIRIEASDLP